MRAVGSDIQAGEVVLSAGTVIGAAEVGLLATVGAHTVQVSVQAPPEPFLLHVLSCTRLLAIVLCRAWLKQVGACFTSLWSLLSTLQQCSV